MEKITSKVFHWQGIWFEIKKEEEAIPLNGEKRKKNGDQQQNYDCI
jgi:hypothetical protein